MIRLGICTSIDHAAVMKEIGYDYVELGMTQVAQLSDADYAALRDQVKAAPLPVEAMNGMIPAEYPLCCPEGTGKRVQDYLAGAFARAQELGVRVVVFGSGGARRVPEGVTPAQAYRYLADYLALAGRMAAQHGMSIAVEPLRAAECNIIHHVAEAQYLAKRSGQCNVWALADLYHMMQGNENCAAIEESGVIHCHIADRARRFYPAAGDGSEGDYKAFFAALQKSGYDGRVSIEGRCEDFARDAGASFALLDALRRA